MSNWIATPQGTYIAEDGGYLMCVNRGLSSQVYAYNTICRDGTYNRVGDGYPDPESAMRAAEKALNEHRNIRFTTEHQDVVRRLTQERDVARGVLAAVEKLLPQNEYISDQTTAENMRGYIASLLKARDEAQAEVKRVMHSIVQTERHAQTLGESVKNLKAELKRAQDYAAGPTWDAHREVVERLERERDSWQAAHRYVIEREKKLEDEVAALVKSNQALQKERNELSFKLEQTEKMRAYHAVAADKHMDSLRRIAGMLDVPAGERGVHGVIENAVYALKTANNPPELKMLRKIVDDAWQATGVASTVRGLTELADVIQTIRKERDEWRGLAQNHAARLASVRKALQNEQP